MTTEGFERKLTAILSADVKGYSRLMREDEEGTIRTLTVYRKEMAGLIGKHRGRVVDSPGDNVLAEFKSVVDALRCGVEIQKELKAKNAELPEDRRMEFRIGINLGDVVEEGERIYGDGVNIAARVEGLAEPGGICVSGTVYEHVKDKVDLGYESLGEHTVKNIAEPVRVYRVLMEPEAAGKVIGEKRPAPKRWQWMALSAAVAVAVAVVAIWYFAFRPSYPPVEPASVEKMAVPLPDRPSIAVLPFDNMSGDPEQEYIADGITENIITTLSKLRDLFVISRNSTFIYKGKPVKVQQVSQELGVRYVLEGSVQRSGDQVRVMAQLIDAIDGKHLWSERYERDLKDYFELQDDIASKIVAALDVKLVSGEGARLWHKNIPNDLQFIEKYFEGWAYVYQYTKEANMKLRQINKELMDLAPAFYDPYVGLAWNHVMDVYLGMSSSRRESLDEAVKLCKKAMTLDESQDMPHQVLGHIYALRREFDKAIAEGERAIELNPHSYDNYSSLGKILTYVGRTEEAIDYLEKAGRLDPLNLCNRDLGNAYREAGRYEEAIAEYKKCVKNQVIDIFVHASLAGTYAWAGRYEEAREAWSEVKRIDPDMTVEKLHIEPSPYGPEWRERSIAVYHKAGIK